VELAPQFADAWNLRAVALGESGRHDEALQSCDRALALRPALAGAWNNRGMELQALGRPEEALASFDRALAAQPDMLDALNNRGTALACLSRTAEALASYDRALIVAPTDAAAAWNKANLLLLAGDLAAGWPLYEQRLRVTGLPIRREHLAQPRWSGAEPIAGRTLYVYAEQGLGDTLQFCRYVPLLQQRGAHVTLDVQPPLCTLLQSLPGGARIIGQGEEPGAFDLYCSLQSLRRRAASRTGRRSLRQPSVTARRCASELPGRATRPWRPGGCEDGHYRWLPLRPSPRMPACAWSRCRKALEPSRHTRNRLPSRW
jgi:tetratricopeptide (TPR) repeat protein